MSEKAKILIKKLEDLSGKRVILEEISLIPTEFILTNDQIENLARRAFLLTLHRTAVKEVYKNHFAALLQASNIISDPQKINEVVKKYYKKIMDYYDRITTEKDLLI
jgi:predicted secreted protein